jgi:hypothetical protein
MLETRPLCRGINRRNIDRIQQAHRHLEYLGPRVGVMAYRGFNQHPSVYVHIDLPAYADGIDVPVTLTNEEARNWRRISLRLLSC